MGEQRAAPRPPRAQLPRHGAQPVAARCGTRPARGWSPCRESRDPLGWEVTALLTPAHSLFPRLVWSGARGASGFIACVLASSGNFCLASGTPGGHFIVLCWDLRSPSCPRGEWPLHPGWVGAAFPASESGGTRVL